MGRTTGSVLGLATLHYYGQSMKKEFLETNSISRKRSQQGAQYELITASVHDNNESNSIMSIISPFIESLSLETRLVRLKNKPY